jgi:hypothetical protein
MHQSGDQAAAVLFRFVSLSGSCALPVREDTNPGRAAGGKKNPVRLNRAYH